MLRIPRKLVTFQVMRRTVGTDLQKHGTMKDAQAVLRHASIKTTADVYMQEIPSSVRAALNSPTRAIFAKKTNKKQRSAKSSKAMLPNCQKGILQVPEKIGSSGRTRTYNPPVNSRISNHGALAHSMT
jgi:integrase